MPKAVLPDLNVLLVFFRSGQGWSQAELADAAGIPPSLLNDYEKGRKPVTRERLEHLAGVMGIPPERIDESLACLEANRSASRAAAYAPGTLGVSRRRIDAIAARAGRLIAEATRSLLTLLTAEGGEALVARQRAERQMERLRKRTPAQRLFLVDEARDYRHWALAERAALESLALAPNHPQESRTWAELAVHVAELVPGEELWRRRLRGWTLHVRANAERVCSDLPAADGSLAMGGRLWEAGAPEEPALLDPAVPPWIEANLRKAQRRFGEALRKIDEALELDGGELRAQILLSKSNILRRLDDSAGSTAVLLEAEPLIDARHEPRLAFGVQFNLLVDLCGLGRAAEARPRLAGIRALAERMGEPLDLTRCTWLHGKVEAGLGHAAEALAAFGQARRDFREREIAYDYALVSLDLSLVLLDLGRSAEVAGIAQEMLWIFKSQGVHREALAALRLFCEAAKRKAATVELARRVERYLRRAQLDPELRFEG
jgi:transcriptional regulator with XRE-family HTH domain